MLENSLAMKGKKAYFYIQDKESKKSYMDQVHTQQQNVRISKNTRAGEGGGGGEE